MSRGFVKENDQEEIPMVPPRADLPMGITNYVTRMGYNLLLAEKEILRNEKEQLNTSDENERRIAVNFINAKMELLNERIASAKVVELNNQLRSEVRFGVQVTLEINNDKKPQNYKIVGVDEANIKEGKISFISPIAQLLLHKKVGEEAILKLANKSSVFKIIAIESVLT
jgi:transcription elongation factor GreB